MTPTMKLTDEQLTRLAAEKVMDWTWEKSMRSWKVEEDGEMCMAQHEGWSPLTDWRAAGEIVERMGAIGWWLKLTSPFESGSMWQAGFTPLSTTGWNGRPDHRCTSKVGQKAIVISALLAVEAITADQIGEKTGYL